MRRYKKRKGQAILELAFLIPFLLLLIANVVNYGGMFFAAITVANAARHGSQHFAYGAATVKNSPPPTAAEVWALIQNETAALPNPTSLSIRVCRENRDDPSSPACTPFGSTTYSFTSPAVDTRTEGVNYLNTWVDVGYTYAPYIPLFTVPVINVSLSPAPQTLVRQSLMRRLH